MKKRGMIRAAALSYAIVFALLIGLICSGVIFITATQKKIEISQTNKEHLLLDSYAAIQYGKINIKENDSVQLVHASGDTSVIKRKLWGGLSIITSVTRKNNVEKKRVALVGVHSGNQLPSLYLPGNSSGLKVAGSTRLEGIVYVPNKSVEVAYLSEKNYTNPELVYGEIRNADNFMPPLKKTYCDLNFQTLTEGISARKFINTDSCYSFFDPTTYYREIGPIVLDKKMTGNVIIHSFDSIIVRKTARLENVIMIAPVVHFESGFKGTVQVLSSEQIRLEPKVSLKYPSMLILNETELKRENDSRVINIGEESKVLGGILMTTQSYDYRKPPYLHLSEKALIAGLVYNFGVSEIRGNIIGSIYTMALSLNYGGGKYSNHLLDTYISTKKLPREFCLPTWLNDFEEDDTKIIAWI